MNIGWYVVLDDVRRSFQARNGPRRFALESARPPLAGGLSFCAAKPRKNLRRTGTCEMKLFGVSAQTQQLKNQTIPTN